MSDDVAPAFAAFGRYRANDRSCPPLVSFCSFRPGAGVDSSQPFDRFAASALAPVPDGDVGVGLLATVVLVVELPPDDELHPATSGARASMATVRIRRQVTAQTVGGRPPARTGQMMSFMIWPSSMG
jgi:hypothetical protein